MGCAGKMICRWATRAGCSVLLSVPMPWSLETYCKVESLVLWRSKKELILDNWLIFQGLPKYACHAWWSSYVLQNIFWELVFQSTLVNWNQGLSKNKPKQTRGIYIFIPFFIFKTNKQTQPQNHQCSKSTQPWKKESPWLDFTNSCLALQIPCCRFAH